MDFANAIGPEHAEMLSHLGYLAVFLLVFGESLFPIGFLIPGSYVTTLAGGLAAKGFYSIWMLLFLTSLAAILGNTLSFEIGRRGRHLLVRNVHLCKAIARGDVFFRRYGIGSVFAAHFLGPVRHVIPALAGESAMDRARFETANIPGAILWAGSHLLLGYSFGSFWETALPRWLRITLLVTGSLCILAGSLWIGKRLTEHDKAIAH